MKTMGVIGIGSSLLDKVRFTRIHMQGMRRHANRASAAGRASVISAWRAGKGLTATRFSDEVRGMRSPEWGEFCMDKFGISASRALGLMRLSEAFGAPDDIPDDCDSVDKAVRFARAALRGLKATVPHPAAENKRIERGIKDWMVQNWQKDEHLKGLMGVKHPTDGSLRPEVAVRGAASARPEIGYIDLLARHAVKDWWTMIEVKVGLVGEQAVAQLLRYARWWRARPGARPGMRVDLVLIVEKATPGLAAAAAQAGVRLTFWTNQFSQQPL